jgi:hypothetical protein
VRVAQSSSKVRRPHTSNQEKPMPDPTNAGRLAHTLATLSGRERRDTLACAVIESGGLYPYPVPTKALLEIQLYGVHVTGIGEEQAIDNWVATAIGTTCESAA